MLTEEQKNYISMLSLGGPITEEQTRDLLARSGWGQTQIEAAVAYTQGANKKAPSVSPLQAPMSDTLVRPVVAVPKAQPVEAPLAPTAMQTVGVSSLSKSMSGLVTPPTPIVMEKKHPVLTAIVVILVLAIIASLAYLMWYMYQSGFGPFAA